MLPRGRESGLGIPQRFSVAPSYWMPRIVERLGWTQLSVLPELVPGNSIPPALRAFYLFLRDGFPADFHNLGKDVRGFTVKIIRQVGVSAGEALRDHRNYMNLVAKLVGPEGLFYGLVVPSPVPVIDAHVVHDYPLGF